MFVTLFASQCTSPKPSRTSDLTHIRVPRISCPVEQMLDKSISLVRALQLGRRSEVIWNPAAKFGLSVPKLALNSFTAS